MQSVKAVRKAKHIRQVKYALHLREQAKERLAPIKAEKRESREYIERSQEYKKMYRTNERTARKNAREDFHLGPLRPNRAVGQDAKYYGTMHRELSSPEIPKHWFNAKPGAHLGMKNKVPEHILKDQWPIVVGDRVVLMTGKDKGKIGVVKEVEKSRDFITITDLNMVYADSRVMRAGMEESKMKISAPMRYADVRLVTPHDTYVREAGGNLRKVRQDVIVESIELEKHVKGINPFTGESQATIPVDEQIDPETEEVPYHRYIAGTRTRIPWPWELEKKDKKTTAINNAPAETKEEEATGILGKLRNAVGLKSKTAKTEATQAAEETAIEDADQDPSQTPSTKPREREPQAFDNDTLRHVVESPPTWVPSLVMPPFPETVVYEIRESAAERVKKEKESSDFEKLIQTRREKKAEGKARAEAARQQRLASMKTPLQIKWELAQAKKEKYDPSEPPKVSKKFLYALGKHAAVNQQQLRK